ncbi:MAG: pilus assembly protein TadG-related protein [Pseudomonadota bacterium]
MVLFLGFVAAMTGMLLVSFNSGQVSNAKMRAMNAADAAAYSGAVWEARSLNFQAYMNRAIIVNEVTIAQSVSLRSWVSYLNIFVRNINYIAQFVPWVGTATTAIHNALNAANNGVQNFLPIIETLARGINQGEHGAQVIMNAGAVLAAQEIASVVATKNGASLSPANAALWVSNQTKWNALTKTYARGNAGIKGPDGRVRLKEVTLASRDGFTKKRDRKFGSKWVQTEFRKQGGTDLIDYDAWKGLDSAEWRNVYIKDWVIRIPLGWGGAQSYSPRVANNIGTHGDINEWNDQDGKNARSMANNRRANAKMNNGGAFPGYRDISNPKVQDETLSVPFAVEVVIAGTAIPTANSVNKAKSLLTDGTLIDHDPHYATASGGVYALAEACVTFERPYKADRRDGRKEYPSLFNPYWRASLATESTMARVIVDSAKMLFPVAAITNGNGSCKNTKT